MENTPTTHGDYANLKQAWEECNKIVLTLNEQKRQTEHLQKLLDLQQNIETSDGEVRVYSSILHYVLFLSLTLFLSLLVTQAGGGKTYICSRRNIQIGNERDGQDQRLHIISLQRYVASSSEEGEKIYR